MSESPTITLEQLQEFWERTGGPEAADSIVDLLNRTADNVVNTRPDTIPEDKARYLANTLTGMTLNLIIQGIADTITDNSEFASWVSTFVREVHIERGSPGTLQ